MNLHLNARNAIVAVFIAASLASLSYVAFSESNYLHYYPGVLELDAETSAVSVQLESSSGNITVQSSILVRNPSSYSGFKLYSVQDSLFFFNLDNNETVFQDHPITILQTGARPLAPNSEIRTDLSVKLTPEQSNSFSAFNQIHAGRILARATILIQISSFLDPVTGRVTFNKSFNIPIS